MTTTKYLLSLSTLVRQVWRLLTPTMKMHAHKETGKGKWPRTMWEWATFHCNVSTSEQDRSNVYVSHHNLKLSKTPSHTQKAHNRNTQPTSSPTHARQALLLLSLAPKTTHLWLNYLSILLSRNKQFVGADKRKKFHTNVQRQLSP